MVQSRIRIPSSGNAMTIPSFISAQYLPNSTTGRGENKRVAEKKNSVGRAKAQPCPTSPGKRKPHRAAPAQPNPLARLRRNCARKPPPSTSPPAAVTLRANGRKASNHKARSCLALRQTQDGLRGSEVEAQANWSWLLRTDLE